MPVVARVVINIDPTQKILLKRNLGKDSKVQSFFTSEVARLSNPYVPFDTGTLKDTTVKLEPNKIIYKAPYAQKQYNENKGKGLRGKQWIPRMWADRGDELVSLIAKMVGGKSK